MPPALDCRGLVKRYGELVAVDGLDLAVAAGECFGLLGPNGAGKTTTVEIFEGLLAPSAGEVTVLGERWRGDGRALRTRLGIQLQETKFPEKLQAGEILALFRSFYPRGLEPAEALARVGLTEKAGPACAPSPGARSSGCRSPARSSATRRCSSSTSRRPGSLVRGVAVGAEVRGLAVGDGRRGTSPSR